MPIPNRIAGAALWCVISISLQGHAWAFPQADRTSPFCSYRNYFHLLPGFVEKKVVSTVRVFPAWVVDKQRVAVSRLAKLALGRDELGRHNLYVPMNEAGEAYGLLRIHSEPGDHGLVFFGIFLDTELKIRDYSLLQYRGSAKEWLTKNVELKKRIRGASAKTLRSWLDAEGTSISAEGVKALGLGSTSARNRQSVVHLLRISIKVVHSTDLVWGPRLRTLKLIGPRLPESAAEGPERKDT